MNEIFLESLAKLLKLEGVYSNDKDDKGGETYCGISRNNFPNWLGWLSVDQHKGTKSFLEILQADMKLELFVRNFYMEYFWQKMNCDILPDLIASKLFELSVNVGIKRATIILQTALNILNNNQIYYSDILEDGVFGNKTLAVFQTALSKHSAKRIFNVINILQGSFYIRLMQNNTVYEKYIGWFDRLELLK